MQETDKLKLNSEKVILSISFLKCKIPAVANKYNQVLLEIFVEKTVKDRVYIC